VSPSTVSSTIVPEAVSERFPVLALIYPQFPSIFSTLVTPDAVVAIDFALIAQARIEYAPLTSLIEPKIAPQLITVMPSCAHNLPVRSLVAPTVCLRPGRWPIAALRLCRDAHSEQEQYADRERTQNLLECTDFHAEPPPYICGIFT
jgi:hypothetical protein